MALTFPLLCLVLSLKCAICNEASRELTHVNAIQNVDTSIFPPSSAWMADRDNTGEGIWIGIYDEPIDTTRGDFREDNNGVSQFRGAPIWDRAYGGDRCCPHGSSVASIAAGNGWLSDSSGGSRYQYRGIAFKSTLVSGIGDGLTGAGDVNNHSSVNDAGSYNGLARLVDSTLFNHRDYRHTVVYAAGNNGDRPAYGVMQGYYSIQNHAKNPIVVGAVYKETGTHVQLSSMGPTLDGRIKPDVMAPGASYSYPRKAPVPLRVYFDSIVIRNDGVKKAWRFNLDNEGWENSYKTENITASGGILSFNSIWMGSWIRNQGFYPPFLSAETDTLVIGYKLAHPDIPTLVNRIQCGISWRRFNNPDSLTFNLPAPDTNWHEARIALANLWGSAESESQRLRRWKGEVAIDSLWLGFHSDTILGLHSLLSAGSTLGNYRYNQGTSEAAPHVTGIVALMLQSYQRKGYLKPGQDIHHSAPWNSTIKALLIHTATDLIKRDIAWPELNLDASNKDGVLNPDLMANEPNLNNAYTRYYPGPDYATGYGLVNAQRAMAFVDTARFKQDSLREGDQVIYSFKVPAKAVSLRATLAWDDYQGDEARPFEPQLVNDLELILVSPKGRKFHPWVLKPLPQNGAASSGIDPIHASDIDSAFRGINHRDNVEVVDVPKDSLVAGIWKLVVRGNQVPHGPQDFSVVSDFSMTKSRRKNPKSR